jgi:3-hydroxybutyryl-CoA dehydrogenase
VHLGAPFRPAPEKTAVLVELGTECLGVHVGEAEGREGSNALGFARWRNGGDPPSPLVEIVRQPRTSPEAVAAAVDLFRTTGLTPVVVADQAGRIVDRLMRPVFNAALRFLDEGLATQEDMDLTCRLGLGYPEGPIERVARGGLAHHYDVTRALFEVYGTPGFAPARRAVVAAQRRR